MQSKNPLESLNFFASMKPHRHKMRVYLGVKTLRRFSLFIAILRDGVYDVDFFVFFVLCHWWVSQVLTPRMSPKWCQKLCKVINPLITKLFSQMTYGIHFLHIYGSWLHLGPWTLKKWSWPISSHLDLTHGQSPILCKKHFYLFNDL